jgi:sterol desaturase/sphingolipid hydroxylase (fatty acid hydroxylase superfamily)
LVNEVVGFLGLGSWITILRTGDYSVLRTYGGITSAIGPLIPFLLVFEIVRALINKTFKVKDYRLIFLIYVLNRFLGTLISIGAVAFCIGLFEPYRLFETRFTWYWIVYAYLVWELAHFVYHYLAHKVRLLWCLHSTHHAPESMNLFVSHAHFFLEAPYADVVRTSICILLGVSPPLLFFVMFVDGTWGAFIHAGEHLLKDGRLGFLNRFVLTPSHHRVHHSRNALYMDTNFCNLLNVWDRAFGTLQPESAEVPPEYGIRRPMNPGSVWDVYVGEIIALWRDVTAAPGLKNKLLYLLMPPGWSHTGDHKTATMLRQAARS